MYVAHSGLDSAAVERLLLALSSFSSSSNIRQLKITLLSRDL
jgi:hypothetical protein